MANRLTEEGDKRLLPVNFFLCWPEICQAYCIKKIIHQQGRFYGHWAQYGWGEERDYPPHRLFVISHEKLA